MQKFKFANQTIVNYDNGVFKGSGKVLGYATTEMPVTGAMVIVEDLSGNVPNETYPFSAFTVAECHLKLEK